jgi:hypothetical protein
LVTVTNIDEPPALPGDYNRDDGVDAADYVLWRKMLGTGGVPNYDGADGDGDGDIDPGDYDVWTTHFGKSVPGFGGAPAMAISSVLRTFGSIGLATESEPTDLKTNSGRSLPESEIQPLRRQQSVSQSKGRIAPRYLHDSHGNDLLAQLLAFDRLERESRRDFHLDDSRGHDDPHANNWDSHESHIESLALALTEWRRSG